MKRILIISISILFLILSVVLVKKYTNGKKEIDSENNISVVTQEYIINQLKEYKENIDNQKIEYKGTMEVGTDILGSEIDEYIKYFDTDKITVDIEISKDLIILIPYPDSLETQKIYYKDGKLVIFEYISNTVGGKVTYYFEKEQLIKCEINYEEDIEYIQLDPDKLAKRANKIYNDVFLTFDKTHEVKTEKLEDSIVDNNNVTVFKKVYEYPVIVGNGEIIAKINKEIKQDIESRFNNIYVDEVDNQGIIEAYYDYVNTFMNGNTEVPFEDKLGFEVKYNKNNIISISYKSISFTGGAHPNAFSEGITYDLLIGKKIEAYEYLDIEKEKMYDIVEKEMIKKYVENEEEYTNSARIKDNIEYIQYYLTEEGVYFFFTEYIIGPHAMGEPFVLISYDKLK